MATSESAAVDFGDVEWDNRTDEMEATIDEWIDDLVAAIEDARGTERFTEWLEAASAFHEYSYKNQLLIRAQMPSATRVAGYNAWQDDFDRHVKEGESGIYIWRPKTITASKCPHCGNAPGYHPGNESLDCPLGNSEPDEWDEDPDEWTRGSILIGFTTATVFDVSQTEGEPLPELDCSAQAGEAENMTELLDTIQAASDTLGIDLTVKSPEEYDHKGQGYCETSGDTPSVVVKERDPAAMAGTIIHEYAHGILHTDEVNTKAERDKREVEAEGAAYIAGRRLGLDMSGSAFYLASWTDDDTEMIRDRLKRINKAAKEIVAAIEE